MELQIKNKIITAPIEDILKAVRAESNNGYLNYIGNIKNDNVAITCPFHKNGQEQHPSCHVYARHDNPNITFGTVHCFTCGKSVPLYALVGKCFDKDDEFGKQWLLDNFGNTITYDEELLPEIILDKPTKKYLDNSILSSYNYFHPYLESRHLKKEICEYFQVGYDKDTDCITFPVWDENSNLIGITRRSVVGKKYIIEGNIDKPIYLLNFIKQFKIDSVIVVEGQVDALRAWSNGYPAVALFGAGTTQHQIDLLNKSGIYHFILMYDNDVAGRKGAEKFKRLISKDRLVTDILMPPFKDVGDCSKEELEELLLKNDVLNCFNH